MKLLFDQNISFRIEKKVPIPYDSSKHISSLGLTNKKDIEIWNFAKSNGYTIVTFDSDFIDLSLIHGVPPKIIWIRQGNLSTNTLASIIDDKQLVIQNFITNIDKATIACLEI